MGMKLKNGSHRGKIFCLQFNIYTGVFTACFNLVVE